MPIFRNLTGQDIHLLNEEEPLVTLTAEEKAVTVQEVSIKHYYNGFPLWTISYEPDWLPVLEEATFLIVDERLIHQDARRDLVCALDHSRSLINGLPVYRKIGRIERS